MKIKIVGDAMVVVSEAKLQDIKTLEKYAPEALSLTNKDGERYFTIATTDGNGSVSKYGVAFSGKTTEGNATITMCIPSNVEDKHKYAVDKIGMAVMAVNEVEEQIKNAIGSVNDKLALVDSAIEVE